MPQDPSRAYIGGWKWQMSFAKIIVKKFSHPRRLPIPGSTTVYNIQ